VGVWTRSVHVPEQVGLKTFAAPAKFPQMVVSKISVCGPKNLVVSHAELGKNAVGVGQLLGLGLAVGRSVGMDERLKNQILIPASSQSIAKTPPPFEAKPAPNEFADGSSMMQPSSPLVWLKQSVEMTVPVSSVDDADAAGCMQPLRVCNV